MLSFKKFFNEHFYLSLNEKKSGDASKNKENNSKGVLHELLTGYHLNGGKHMSHHTDSNGKSPKEVHDEIKNSMSVEEYKKRFDDAKSAAEDIKKKLPANHKIHQVHWTSKPGDIHRSTGTHATQGEDSSDIMIHTKDNNTNKTTFNGVSLKTTDKSDKNVPSSSLGITSSGSKAKELFVKHKSEIIKAHPSLAKQNDKIRKEILRSNPEMDADISRRNTQTLNNVAASHADELNHQLKSGDHEKVINHIRGLLHANRTPLQKVGHNFIKHTTYKTAKGTQHHTSNPGEEYEHILNDHKNISAKSSGTTVSFYHKGKKFAMQAHKFNSQTDPLSSLKSAGRAT